MTAPEREALVSQLKYSAGADESEAHGLRRTSLNTQRALDLEMQAMLKRNAAAAIEAMSNAPAVTVTEEMVDCAYDAMVANNPEVQGGIGLEDLQCGLEAVLASPRKSERDAIPAFIHLPDGARDIMARYERDARGSAAGIATGRMWDEVRHYLQSTTPQTGSQE